MQSDELQSISARYRGRPTTIHCDIDQKRVYRKIDGKKQPTCVEQTEVRKKCPTGKIKHKEKCIKKEDKPTGKRGRPPACDEGKKRVYRKVDGVKTRTCVKPTEVRKKCPTGKINHKGKCIKKGDKPTGTRGRPKKQPLLTKDTIQKKTQLSAQAAAQKKRKEQAQAATAQKKRKEQAQAATAQKKRKEQAQQKQAQQKTKQRFKLNRQIYDEIVDEIFDFYMERFSFDNPWRSKRLFDDRLYIDEKDLNRYFPSFLKFSGISKDKLKEIMKECEKEYHLDKSEKDRADGYGDPFSMHVNVLILNNILAGKVCKIDGELPIEVLFGTVMRHGSFEQTEHRYGNYDEYITIYKLPRFLDKIKSFSEERYNKFLRKIKEC